MLEVTKVDLARCDTVLKALKRGKYDLEGEEVLAFAQAFAWLGQHYEKLRSTVETQTLVPPSPVLPAPAETKGKAKK